MLGEKMRNIRKNKKKTLSDVSKLTDLSISYISQIERDAIEPSLSSLRKIAEVLDTPLYMFMDDNNTDDLVIRKEDRVMMKFPKSEMFYEIVSPMPTADFAPSILFLEFELKPESEDTKNYISHASEEVVVLTSGVVDICIGENIVRLNPGDSTFIKANTPHKIINPSKDTLARGYGVISPPIWPIKSK
ncbi:helix-turn-helix domain-containing protein [Clostridioides difficile]|nr:XRE family transcriptional regulator [Clostridioides difficile]UWD47850.1 XRE family transcriptional regulator [Clostridioides difficile]